MPCRNRIALACGFLLIVLSSPAVAATLTVINSADSGAGSLRAALGNAVSGDDISFASSVTEIHLASGLTVAQRVLILGTTQTIYGPGGGSAAISFVPSSANSVLTGLAILNGGGAAVVSIAANGVAVLNCRIGIDRGDSTGSPANYGLVASGVTGLTIGMPAQGNVISGNLFGISLTNCMNAYILGNHIGTDSSGTYSRSNNTGVYFDSGTHNSFILEGNLISGNVIGVQVQGSGNSVAGNVIGLNASQSAPIPNTSIGVSVEAPDNVIGQAASNMGNVIAGNPVDLRLYNAYGTTVKNNFIGCTSSLVFGGNYGVEVDGSSDPILIGGDSAQPFDKNVIAGHTAADVYLHAASSGVVLSGNWIGVLPDLSAPGSLLPVGVNCAGSMNTIGSPGGPGNLIANVARGVYLSASGAGHNLICANTICANATAPIDRVSNANQNKAAPVITSALTTFLKGVAGAGDRVEAFRAEPRAGAGGSLAYLGAATADGSGNWSLVPSGLANGDYVCAQATDVFNNSSLFSANVIAAVPTPTSTTTDTPPVTPTLTATPTLTSSSTSTASPTQTVSSTPTPSPTVSHTPTVSPTQTGSPTVTPSPTVSHTPTFSPTQTVSSTPTPSPTVSLTPTFSPTQTAFPAVTQSPTVSLTPTVLPTRMQGDGTIRAFPNPARDRIHIRVSLLQPGETRILLYNMAGERVVELKGSLPSGTAELVWECGSVAPGIYLAQVMVDGVVRGKLKLAVVK